MLCPTHATIFKVKVLIKPTSKYIAIVKHTFFALCVALGFSFHVAAGGKAALANTNKTSKAVTDGEAANEGMQQTLELNFSPESREKLRKALDDYARSIDQDHERIEDRRRAMQESLEARFFDADNDGDDTIDRQEATEKLPQIARHFNQVDTNQDDVISLDELAIAQNRILERRKAAEATIAAQNLQSALELAIASKPKAKKTTNNTKKRAL
ncbi:MAG: periplasmic heavy metal sensor [Methylotenera sp.]|nr:periplasmic heavy metal sensor [Methylotenera sp.]MSP99840.1 periplasmic heavy metal sensor [Methylotenera sp.]